MKDAINLLATLDANYIPYLNTMLFSALYSNPGEFFRVFILQNSIEPEELASTEKILGTRGELVSIRVDESRLEGAPTSDRYPPEIYYRIFAAKYLPEDVNRILYLDPDIIVNKPLRELYYMPMGSAYFAAATHIRAALHRFNELRIDMGADSPYINSGVILMNLSLLREEQNFKEVFDFIEAHKGRLFLPDQDIISGLYGHRIIELDRFKYNMTERLFEMSIAEGHGITLEDVRENAVIIHYIGRNKPWKSGYIGKLGVFYDETVQRMDNGNEA